MHIGIAHRDTLIVFYAIPNKTVISQSEVQRAQLLFMISLFFKSQMLISWLYILLYVHLLMSV
jgi:hypothetical protein